MTPIQKEQEQPDKKEKDREKNIEAEDNKIKSDTPVWQYRMKIRDAIESSNKVILKGGTASGKTTMIYPIIRPLLSPKDRVILTQPRKKSTKKTAERVAETILGGKIGREVGYQYRGGGRESPHTKMNFTTDGTLLRMLQEDKYLSNYTYAIIDETHEPTKNIVAAIALLERAQELRKARNMPPLKIITMSATVDTTLLKQQLGKEETEVVDVPGKMYHVEPHFNETKVEAENMPIAAARKAFEEIFLKDERREGDLLIFMPGKGEIRMTEYAIRNLFDMYKKTPAIRDKFLDQGLMDPDGNINIDIFPFHAQLSEETLEKSLLESNKRKIIIATDAAETGLTIKTLKYVIDSGKVNQTQFDPATGITVLNQIDCARSALDQRKGRAGREAPGDYFPLFTESDYKSRPYPKDPEIERTDLTQFLLLMKKSGVENLSDLHLIYKPDETNLAYARNILKKWGAMKDDEELTERGRLMAELNADPRLAYLSILGAENGCGDEACTIAAYLTINKEKSLFSDDEIKKAFITGNSGSDFDIILNFWKQYNASTGKSAFLTQFKINGFAMEKFWETREDLITTLQEHGKQITSDSNKDMLNRITAEAFSDRIFIRDYTSKERMPSYTHINPDLRNKMKGLRVDSGSAAARIYPEIVIIADDSPIRYVEQIHPLKISNLTGVKDIAPMIRSFPDAPFFNAVADRVLRPIKYELKNIPYSDYTAEEVTGSEATRVFARALANNVNYPPTYRNLKMLPEINRSRRERNLAPLDLAAVYESRLGNIASMNELIPSGINLLLSPEALPSKDYGFLKPKVETYEPQKITVNIPKPEEKKGGLLGAFRRFFGGITGFFSRSFGRKNK